jgi:hypothetical protein
VPLRIIVRGEFGVVYSFVRENSRCPADVFLGECEGNYKKKFQGSFDSLTKQGADYENQVRFKGLHDYGRPLWEFKEHDHRIYAVREILNIGEGSEKKLIAVVVLLNGWKKDKDGKAKEEKIKIAAGQTLYAEYQRQGVRDGYGNQESLAIATERAHRSRC